MAVVAAIQVAVVAMAAVVKPIVMASPQVVKIMMTIMMVSMMNMKTATMIKERHNGAQSKWK